MPASLPGILHCPDPDSCMLHWIVENVPRRCSVYAPSCLLEGGCQVSRRELSNVSSPVSRSFPIFLGLEVAN